MDKIVAKEIELGPEEEFGVLDGSFEEQIAALEKFLGLKPGQLFHDIDVQDNA